MLFPVCRDKRHVRHAREVRPASHVAPQREFYATSPGLPTAQVGEMRERLVSMGADVPVATTVQEFTAYVPAQIAQMRQLIKETGLRPD